jgi:large subunit ribosomal protein L17
MRKHIFGRQLQRDINERKALFKSLMSALVVNESIQTTEAKAKSIKGQIEKLVTKALKGGIEVEKDLSAYFSRSVLAKFVKDVAPRFANRPGGYTRIIRLSTRFGDNAKVVILEWVVKAEVVSDKKKAESKEQRAESEKKEDIVEGEIVKESSSPKATDDKKKAKKIVKKSADTKVEAEKEEKSK